VKPIETITQGSAGICTMPELRLNPNASGGLMEMEYSASLVTDDPKYRLGLLGFSYAAAGSIAGTRITRSKFAILYPSFMHK